MTGDVISKVAEWAQTTLVAANLVAGSAVYYKVAPQGGTVYPCLVHSELSSVDLNALGPQRCFNVLTYQVMGVAKGASINTLAPVMGSVDTTLHGTEGTVSGLRLHWLREAMRVNVTEVGGVQWRELQYQFRVWATDA